MRLSVANGRLRVWAERFEEIEPELLDYIDGLPEGCSFYDAGASIGHFSLYAAIKRKACVTAFEPEAQNFGTLELNHFLNRHALTAPFAAFDLALADCKGLGRIFTRSYGAGEHVKILDASATRDTHEPFAADHVQTVMKLSLDEFVAEYAETAPEALKIDVDGAEIPLLRGAQRTLSDPRLRSVFIELTGTDTEEERILRARGLELDSRAPVVRMSGGFYPDLFNCVFRR